MTVLRKRDAFRRAFAGFDPRVVARFGPADVDRCLADPSIIRHHAKIEAAVANARAAVALQDDGGSLAALLWSFEPDRGSYPVPEAMSDLPASTPESTALAQALRRAGFRFVGPTTAYAAMQSLGVVNDHLAGCPVRASCEDERRRTAVPDLPADLRA